MNNIPMSPKAKKFVKDNDIDISMIEPTGKDGEIRYAQFSDVKDMPKATPLAVKIAAENHVDLSKVEHKQDRISREDVLKYVHTLDEKKASNLSGARLKIAQNLTSSVMETIAYTLFAKINTDKAYACYKQKKAASSVKITFTDILTLAVSRALKKNLLLNTTRRDGYYLSEDSVNICLAIDNEGSILTPVIRNADSLTVEEIANMRISFMDRINRGKMSPEDFADGTFTISNLGMGLVGHFTPVINYPQSGILGIGRTDDELYLDDGKINVRKVTHFSLTVDHAIIDGKAAAVFLDELQECLDSLSLSEV